MLSRVAETLYWIGRYQERAENLARLIQVNTNLILDLPKGITPDWDPLIKILGCENRYVELHEEMTERRIVSFLVSDKANPGSILSVLDSLRENARTVREVLPREGWETINELFHFANDNKSKLQARKDRHHYLEQIMRHCQLLTGLLAGTMNHDLGYGFLNIGRKLERADMTTRIIDVRAENTIPENVPELKPFEDILLMSMLKSVSGYQMYRQIMHVRIRRDDVLKFLLSKEKFPRSVLYCVRDLELNLSHLPNHDCCLGHLSRLDKALKKPDKKIEENSVLHEFIDKLQLQLAKLHDDISKSYFPQVS